MTNDFTKDSLPEAVRWLFEANGYSVEGPIHINGAEIDLVATQVVGMSTVRVYIEVTIQYVDTAKYGKDLTKLAMFQNERMSQALIISSSGFTPDVKERASAINIETLTYDQLFASFEKLEPYIDSVLGQQAELGKALHRLDEVYEEPKFSNFDQAVSATQHLWDWVTAATVPSPWIVIVGEYGTGKTALTQVLQRRWTRAYQRGDRNPLPFRIELREFSRQFDSRGLLHHFLDHNRLEHLNVRFVESMIANGRVVLLLDGYDEMAQYLNVRERRACIEALSNLASGGARGILTSRPNYFSEAEELRVFEALYQRISERGPLSGLGRADLEAINDERRVDSTLDRFFIRREERQLEDLTAAQTEELVRKQLAADPEGAELVIRLLQRIIRRPDEGATVSLAGKPVIVSYLLDVLGELKVDEDETTRAEFQVNEWQIFEIIIEKLMLRDFRRTPELAPSERRAFLGALAVRISSMHEMSIAERDFRDLVSEIFKTSILRRTREGQVDYAETLFEDLRSSSTLARSVSSDRYAWRFSHNSLREFLVVDRVIQDYLHGASVTTRIAITDTMRLFARSLPAQTLDAIQNDLASNWPGRANNRVHDEALELAFDALSARAGDPRSALVSVVGPGLDLRGVRLKGVSMNGTAHDQTDLSELNANQAEFVEVDFSHASLARSNFSSAALDSCNLRGVDVLQAQWDDCLLLDCDLSGTSWVGTSLLRLDADSTAYYESAGRVTFLSGSELIGYLAFHGADVGEIDPYFVYRHHQDFEICEKICKYLLEHPSGQRRGLERRGASQRNPALARRFVNYLLANSLVEVRAGRSDVISATIQGRAAMSEFVERQTLPSILASFFHDETPGWQRQ